MSNSYQKIMNQITVTDEMRDRILSNVTRALDDVPSAEKETQAVDKNKGKIMRFRTWQKYASVAAAAVVIVICATFIPRIMRNVRPADDPLDVSSGIFEMAEYASAEELSQAAGYEVNDIENIPFEVTHTTYNYCVNCFTDIVYEGADNHLSYRTAIGTDDISGDYTDYSDIQIIEKNGCEFTVKGDNGRYQLAIWQKDGYAFAIYLEKGIGYEEMVGMLR